MTSIAGITTTESPWQGREQPKPSRDFAQELARQEASPHDEAKTAAGNENSELREEMASGAGTTEPDTPVGLPQEVIADQGRNALVEPLPEAVLQDAATTQPVGMTEALLGARVFGWHALAQSYLSELAAFDGMPTEGILPAEAEASLIQLEPQVEEATRQLPHGVAEAPAMDEAPEAVSVAEPASVIEGTNDLVSGAETNASCVAAMASADYWAERSLRFTRQPDGRGVAWLRDYRLDAAKAGQVVRWVLAEAGTKGFTLDRIMLNGREAWSSRSQV